MKKNRKNCNTCLRGMLLSKCEELNKNEEFQEILKNSNMFDMKKHNFKENFICDNYKSRYIEYPLEVNKITCNNDKTRLSRDSVGKLAKIRPCGEEYENKTYLGLFLGELPISNHVSYSENEKELKVGFISNPAIFVFELNKIIYGNESWWGIIDSPEELNEITDKDINDVWYVKLMKSFSDKE